LSYLNRDYNILSAQSISEILNINNKDNFNNNNNNNEGIALDYTNDLINDKNKDFENSFVDDLNKLNQKRKRI